jgi:SAM-dependent methyltransferase
MSGVERWAAVAAALPQRERHARELPFWRALRDAWRWRRVADAGCGAGFHVALLRELEVETFGFDLATAAMPTALRDVLAAGDLLAPPFRAAGFDAVLCLGNTLSLLEGRGAQRAALAALAFLLRPGGVLLVQGEDAGALVAAGPVARVRALGDGGHHVRVFARRGRRVRMLAGVVRGSGDTPLEEAWLLPTGPVVLARLVRTLRLREIPLPLPVPGGGAAWWCALTPA